MVGDVLHHRDFAGVGVGFGLQFGLVCFVGGCGGISDAASLTLFVVATLQQAIADSERQQYSQPDHHVLLQVRDQAQQASDHAAATQQVWPPSGGCRAKGLEGKSQQARLERVVDVRDVVGVVGAIDNAASIHRVFHAVVEVTRQANAREQSLLHADEHDIGRDFRIER